MFMICGNRDRKQGIGCSNHRTRKLGALLSEYLMLFLYRSKVAMIRLSVIVEYLEMNSKKCYRKLVWLRIV